MNWVDIVIILILLIGCAIGVWKGFFKSLLSLVSTSVVFLCSFLLCKPTANFLMKKTSWDTSLCSKISKWLSGISPKFDVDMVGMGSRELSKHISQTLSSKGFPKFFRFIFKITTSITPESIAHKTTFTMNMFVSQTLTIVTFVISCFVLYVILFFAIKLIVGHFTKRWTEKSPIAKKVDRGVGAVFGLVRGFVWVFVIFAFTSIFKNAGFFSKVNAAISSSAIGSPISSFVYSIVDKYFNLHSMIKLISKI